MMTAIILSITVRHKVSGGKGESILQKSSLNIALATGEPHVPISEPITGKGIPWEGLFQPLLRVQKREDKWTKALFCVVIKICSSFCALHGPF